MRTNIQALLAILAPFSLVSTVLAGYNGPCSGGLDPNNAMTGQTMTLASSSGSGLSGSYSYSNGVQKFSATYLTVPDSKLKMWTSAGKLNLGFEISALGNETSCHFNVALRDEDHNDNNYLRYSFPLNKDSKCQASIPYKAGKMTDVYFVRVSC